MTAALLAIAAACSGDSAEPGVSGAPPLLGPRASFEGLSFEIPAVWVAEQPAGGMRRAQYRIPAPRAGGESGECALFHFPGQGGSVQANLDRWYRQFEQPDGSDTASHARVGRFQAGGLSVTLVEVGGTYLGGMGPGESGQPRPGFRLVAGVVETASGPWFLKCTGPDATMSPAAPGVQALLRSAGP